MKTFLLLFLVAFQINAATRTQLNTLYLQPQSLPSASISVEGDVVYDSSAQVLSFFDGVSFSPVDTGALVACEIRLHTGNGHGSTNTVIRRFTTKSIDIGTCLTHVDSATLGMTITIDEDGVYCITYSDVVSTGGASLGISLNSSELTTNIKDITAVDRIGISNNSGAGFTEQVVACVPLSATDIIRAHTDTTQNGVTDINMFTIVKVGNL